MHRSAGAHGGPKWTHAPVPLLMQLKYVPVPGWRTQLGVGQPSSGTTAMAGGVPAAGRTGAARGPAGRAGEAAARGAVAVV